MSKEKRKSLGKCFFSRDLNTVTQSLLRTVFTSWCLCWLVGISSQLRHLQSVSSKHYDFSVIENSARNRAAVVDFIDGKHFTSAAFCRPVLNRQSAVIRTVLIQLFLCFRNFPTGFQLCCVADGTIPVRSLCFCYASPYVGERSAILRFVPLSVCSIPVAQEQCVQFRAMVVIKR